MKNLLFALAFFAFLGCQKDKDCWVCSTHLTSHYGGGITTNFTETDTHCNKSESQIQQIEREGNYQNKSVIVDGNSARQSSTRKCVRK